MHYPWHPLHGETLRIVRRTEQGDQAMIEGERSCGQVRELPEWMTDRELCSRMAMRSGPIVVLEALVQLAFLLGAYEDDPVADDARTATGGTHGKTKANESSKDPAVASMGAASRHRGANAKSGKRPSKRAGRASGAAKRSRRGKRRGADS